MACHVMGERRTPQRCNTSIHVEERCLDEELVGIARKRYAFFDVPIMISDVDHVIFCPRAVCRAYCLRTPRGTDRSPPIEM